MRSAKKDKQDATVVAIRGADGGGEDLLTRLAIEVESL